MPQGAGPNCAQFGNEPPELGETPPTPEAAYDVRCRLGRTQTQPAFAKRLGWTRARLNELIKGKRGVTADAALDLAEALGTSPRL